jgi:hypothetical protein
MNPLYEVAVQCGVGQSALRCLAAHLNVTYNRAVLFAAVKRLGRCANKRYYLPLEKSAPLEDARFVLLKKIQTLVDICKLRLELLERTLREAWVEPLPSGLYSSVQRQGDKCAEVWVIIRRVPHDVEPFASMDTRQTLGVSRRGFARGLLFLAVYAEA